jgi:hypothetical protein
MRRVPIALVCMLSLVLSYAPYVYIPAVHPLGLKQVRTIRIAHADTAGPNSPTAEASTASGSCSNGLNWGTGGAGAEDTTFSDITGNLFDAGEFTDYLELSGFGFSITGTVTGITVEVIGWGFNGTTPADYSSVRLMTASATYVGDEKATGALPAADPGSTYTTFGASSDDWNAGLSETEVNDPGFGVGLCFIATAANSRINIDHVRITVEYSPPPVPPSVTTDTPSNTTHFSATLLGTISDVGSGDATEHGFAFSTDPSLATNVSTSSLGSFTGTGQFSQQRNDLQPSTTYHVRAYATNSSGTGYGSPVTFTTNDEIPARTLRLISGKILINQGGRVIIRQR